MKYNLINVIDDGVPAEDNVGFIIDGDFCFLVRKDYDEYGYIAIYVIQLRCKSIDCRNDFTFSGSEDYIAKERVNLSNSLVKRRSLLNNQLYYCRKCGNKIKSKMDYNDLMKFYSNKFNYNLPFWVRNIFKDCEEES